jgi:phage gp37-like protein
LGAKKLEPFSKHAYMAYLPTVEFGPGMTSATQIRTAWPTLNEKRKTALVMSLYPATQKNPKLAQTVVRLLDAAIGTEPVAEGSTEAAMSNAVTFFRGEPILSQERLNQLKSSIGKPYPILRKEGSAANIGTYMSPDGKKATSFVQQALAGQGTGGTVTQIQVDPNSFSKGDGGIDEAVIITNIAGLVSDQKPNENDPLRIQDRKQAMLKYLGPGVQKYLNDPLLTNPNLVQRWYNPEFAQKNWNTINSGKQAVTKPGESEIQERMISVLGSLAEKIRRDPEVISYFIGHNPGNWIEYNFRMNSDGSGTKVVDVKYYPPAKSGVAEGKLIESAVFLNPTTVVVGQAHGQPLELSPDTLKKIQAIAAKHGAWYEGNGTDRSYTKGQIDRYVGSWDDEVAKTASPNDPKWLYVLFANVDENNRVQRVGVDPNDTIFNRLLTTAQDNSFQGIGYTAQALQKFLQMASEGKYDFVKMSQQPATQQNLTRFLKAGESLMWPSNWEQYPNRAGKIAKAATVDVRDQYLATRKAGVYVTGSGHLKAVQNITGQQAMTESLRVDVPNEDWLNDAVAYAKQKSPDRNGLPYMGKTTATVRPEPMISMDILKRLPGMRNEQQNVRQADLAAIMKIMKDTDKLPLHSFTKEEYKPFINVAYDGSAWVNEGNHRIMAAAALGWKELPVQISYFDGGERVESGPMYPGKIGL